MPEAVVNRRNKIYYNNIAQYSAFDEVLDEENFEIMSELGKLSEDDLEIVKSEIISI